MQAVELLSDLNKVHALAQPVRVQVLDALRHPDSAAGVARAIGRTRQNVNYHLKELARVGLVRHAGERRKGNFVEQLYRAAARRFVVSARFAWDGERLAATLRDQTALAYLADFGERLQRDATALIDRAAFDGETVASATVEAEVAFANDAERSAFLEEYVAALKPLLAKYSTKTGTPYRLALAAYPTPQEDT